MNPYVTTMLVVGVAHFLGDFVCQTNYMASGKSKKLGPLALHVATYNGAIILVIGFAVLSGIIQHGHDSFGFYCLVNSLFHFVTDFFTSRWSSKYWREERPHAFFVVIGFDQLIHGTTFLLTLPILLPQNLSN